MRGAGHDSGTKTIGCLVGLHRHRPEFLALVVVAHWPEAPPGGKVSYARLRKLLDLAESEPVLHGWLTDAIRGWREGQRLDHALELRGPCARAGRDALLRLAASQLPKGMTPWAKAGQISRRLKLPLKKNNSALDSILFKLKKEMKHEPGLASQRRLYEMLRDYRYHSFSMDESLMPTHDEEIDES